MSHPEVAGISTPLRMIEPLLVTAGIVSKTFIVQRVACFDTPSIFVDAVTKDTADDHAPVCRRLPSDEEGRQQPGSEAEGAARRPARPSSRIRRPSPSATGRSGCALSNARQRTEQGAAASLLEHAGNEGGDSYTHRFMFMDTGWGSYFDMAQTKSTDPLPFVPARSKPSRG